MKKDTLLKEKCPLEMPKIGLEPTHLAAPEPKSGVSTNFTTWAQNEREWLNIPCLESFRQP